MDVTVSLNDSSLKKSMTIRLSDAPNATQPKKESPLMQALVKRAMQQESTPKDKTGVPFSRPTMEPRVG